MRIADRFERAAATYEAVTPVQRQAAAALAGRVLETGLAPGPRVAEFGCGTGYLQRALWPDLAPRLWIATDVAPAMVRAAAAALPEGGFAAVMDAARPALKPGFDLVCSSLALQWLEDPEAALHGWRRLVSPGGLLAVATLADGSFAEWRAALAQAGAPPPGPRFPTLEQLRGWLAPRARIHRLALTDRHDDGLAFLRAARAAGIDASPDRALGPGVMRRALRAFEAKGAEISYEVALVLERRP